MTDWQDGAVEVGGAHLSFSRRGIASPGVVVLHGQFGERSVVQPLVESTDRPLVVTPDIRGRGRSVCRDVELHTWQRYVTDITTLLDHLELTSVVLAGVSLGAGLAIAIALAHPERVHALVLWASPYRGEQSDWSDEQRAVQGPIIETAGRVLTEGAAVLDRDDPRTSRRWDRHDPESLAAALTGLGWTQPLQDLHDLNTISAPTLVIPGSDTLHTPELASEYVEALPRGSLGRGTPTAIADFISTL